LGAIEVDRITKKFAEKVALNGVDIRCRKGDFFGLLGPNGAGKTTLLKILTGQIRPTSGNSRVLGVDPATDPVKVKERIGIVPEFESPPSFLTSEEFLTYVCRIRGLNDIEKRVDKQMKIFDLVEHYDTVAKDLSKGTRQKLMLASAMVHEPELLFLDEPFINLDPIYQKRLKDALFRFKKKGGTIFMCTHILSMAQDLCSQVAIIHKGRVRVRGTVQSLQKKRSESLDDIFIRIIETDLK